MPTRLSVKAVDGSTYVVTVSCFDENGDPVVPNTFAWSLLDDDGNVINDRSSVAETPSASISIVLSGADLLYSDGDKRRLSIDATYDSTLGNDLPLKDEITIAIADIVGE